MTKYTYSHWDVMMADPDNPLPKEKRDYQIKKMRDALHNLTNSPEPSYGDWETVSDAVNIMEIILEMRLIEDPQDAIGDAVLALAKSGTRAMAGKPLRLDGPAIGLLKGVLDDYEEVMAGLSERTMIMAHRATEKRTQAILNKTIRQQDVKVPA